MATVHQLMTVQLNVMPRDTMVVCTPCAFLMVYKKGEMKNVEPVGLKMLMLVYLRVMS